MDSIGFTADPLLLKDAGRFIKLLSLPRSSRTERVYLPLFYVFSLFKAIRST